MRSCARVRSVKDQQDPVSGFFAKVRTLFEGHSPAAPEPPVPPRQPAPRPRPEARGTDSFHRTERQLSPTQTTRLESSPTEPSPESAAEASQKRMAFVLAYLQDSDAVPQLKDARFVYKLVSDERAYQSELYKEAEARLRELLALADPASLEDPDAPACLQRQAIEAELQASRDTQTQLFRVLKKVTGKRGRTGGTGFLPT